MRFHFRGFVSLFLMLAFLVLGVSGVVLFVTPRGRVANWTGWTLFGLDKQAWQSVHISIAILFLAGTVLHLWFNWSVFWSYIKKTASLGFSQKAEMAAAVLLAGVVVAGAVFQTPPFRNILEFNDRIKDYWDRWAVDTTASPPTPHAEELALKQLAATMRVSLDDVIKSLADDGIAVDDGNRTLGQVAEKNGLTPRDVYAVIRRHFPDAQEPGLEFGQGRGQQKGQGGGGRGRGKGRLAE